MLILLVEDEPLVAFALEWALKNAGYDILGPADSVDEALELCRRRKPDLALIDLNLRDGGNGAEVARYLHGRHGTPCLFLSAQVAQARVHREVAVGLVRKPYETASLPRLIKYVAALLEGSPPRQAPPEIEVFRDIGG